MTDVRLTRQYVETVVKVIPHVRLTRQYVENVVLSVPHARLTRQYIEEVRLLEVHAVKAGIVIAVKPIIYATNATSPAVRTRTTTATAIVELASVPAVSPASGTTTRHHTVIAIAQTYSPTATPINTSATVIRHRSMNSPTMLVGSRGDNLADAVDEALGTQVLMPFNTGVGQFTVESGEPGRTSSGGTGWIFWTATYTGNATLVIDNYASAYPYIYMYESSVTHATNFGQLTFIASYGYFAANGVTQAVPVTNGHTYYWQVSPYGTGYSGTVVLHLNPPPVIVYTSASVSRIETATNSLVNAGLFTNYVNIGSPVPYNPTVINRQRTVRDTVLGQMTQYGAAALSVDSGTGTSSIGGTETLQTRTATGVVTVDVPIVSIPLDVPAVVVSPPPPTVTVTNPGTGSLIGGDWEFYVAYYVSAQVEGRFTQAGPITGATLPTYDPPAGPTFPPPPGGYDQGLSPTLVNDWGYTVVTGYQFANFVSAGQSYIVTYSTADAYDDTYSLLASDGPGVYWKFFAQDDVTVSFTPIQPANGTCIWELYTYVYDGTAWNWELAMSFDSADPNLSGVSFFVPVGTNYLITSRFYDENMTHEATGSGSYKIIAAGGGASA